MEAIFLDCGAGGPQLKRNPLGGVPVVPLEALEYIVNEIVRRYSSLPPRFTHNIRRNVRRKFKVSISAEEVERLIPLYKAMYKVVATEVHRSLGVTSTPSLEEGDRLAAEFGDYLATRYPREAPSVLGWSLAGPYIAKCTGRERRLTSA